jgi:hypothetical protein
MNEHTLHHINKDKVCDLCAKHDPLVKDYSEDYDLQTSLRNYVEKTSGEKINVADIAKLCDSCYTNVNVEDEEEDDNGRD